MSKKRQLTLGAFGFTKEIIHRGKKTTIEIEETVKNAEASLQIPCPNKNCNQKFVNQQGLSVHLKCVHPLNEYASDHCQRLLEEPAIEFVVRSVLQRTVGIVCKKVEDSVEKIIETVPPPPKVSLRGCSGNKRRSYTATFKLEVIHESESGRKADEIALHFGISRTLVIKWVKGKDEISRDAESVFKHHLNIRPARKYKQLCAELLLVFKEARKKGHRVDFNWIWSKARRIQRIQTGNPEATIGHHVVVNFIKRNNIRMRAQQRNKALPKAALSQKLQEWHATTRERLVRTGFSENYDEKWGRFTPEQRFNVDQSPCPFALNLKRTYHLFEDGTDQHQQKVWISQPGSDLEKRQCSSRQCSCTSNRYPATAGYYLSR